MAYVPHTDRDRARMLEAIGAGSVEDLFRTVPENIRLHRALAVPERRSEPEILSALSRLADRNVQLDTRPSFLGAGVYRRFIPAAVDALAARGEFSTAYTPYQPEASQGTLQAIMEYQTMIARLTGMEISNASLYDGATAVVEAVFMAYAVRKRGRVVLVSEGVHPETRRVLETYVRHHPIRVETIPLVELRTPVSAMETAVRAHGGDAIAVVVQQPNFFGALEDTKAIGRSIQEMEGERPLLIASVDPVSLAVLEPPGAYGADVAVGDGQQLGNPPYFGGPTFGFFATRMEYVRKIPGRIVGETRDRDGRRGYVLTFQTREQHIRRERATSNICTNQGLCALRAAVYLALLGPEGLREVAETSIRRAHWAYERLTAVSGIEPVAPGPFCFEFPVRLALPARTAYRKLGEAGIGGGLPLDRYFPEREREMLFAFTELTTEEAIDRLVETLAAIAERALRSQTQVG